MLGVITNILFYIFKPLLKLIHQKAGYSKDAFDRKCGDFIVPNFEKKRVIMFHGVSVGEINAIEKLVKRVREEFQDAIIVVTTGTNTGQENAIKKCLS